jgi:hypothetical protein
MPAIASTEALVTSVPFLIGFEPKDSIVIVGVKDDKVDCAMRIDYPEQSQFDQYMRLAKLLMSNGVDSVVLVSYFPDHITNPESAVDLQVTFNHYKITVLDSIVVFNGRYKSMFEDDGPDDGYPMPDIKSSEFALETVLDGTPLPFNSIESMKASLSIYDESPEIVQHISTISKVDDDDGRRLGAKTFDKLLEEFSKTGKCSNYKDVALVLVSLKDVVVRDYLLGSVTEENKDDVRSLWRWMLLVAPEGYKAPIACLNAALAYECGSGAEANIFLDIAVEEEEDYSLAILLKRCFSAGWPPESFATMRKELHPKVFASLFLTTN